MFNYDIILFHYSRTPKWDSNSYKQIELYVAFYSLTPLHILLKRKKRKIKKLQILHIGIGICVGWGSINMVHDDMTYDAIMSERYEVVQSGDNMT